MLKRFFKSNWYRSNKHWFVPYMEPKLNYAIRIIFHILKFVVVPVLVIYFVLLYIYLNLRGLRDLIWFKFEEKHIIWLKKRLNYFEQKIKKIENSLSFRENRLIRVKKFYKWGEYKKKKK